MASELAAHALLKLIEPRGQFFVRCQQLTQPHEGTTGGFLATMQAGAGVLAGAVPAAGIGASLGTIGTAAVAGAVGSIASQAVGMAIGAQDSFSWKGVALSAIGSGVSAGLASPGAGSLAAKTTEMAVARAALGNALSQGIAVATGWQDKFSWQGVAAAAAGSAMSQFVSSQVAQGLGDPNLLDATNRFITRATSGMAAGLTTAAMGGGRVSVTQVATDSFGNSIGTSLAEVNLGGSQQDDTLRQRAQENFRASEITQQNADAFMSNYLASTRPSGLSDSSTNAELLSRQLRSAGAGAEGELIATKGGNGAVVGRPRDPKSLESAVLDTLKAGVNTGIDLIEGSANLIGGFATPGAPDYVPFLSKYRSSYDTPLFGEALEMFGLPMLGTALLGEYAALGNGAARGSSLSAMVEAGMPISAAEANAPFLARGWNAPYYDGAPVTLFTTSGDVNLVRVSTSDNPVGAFLAHPEEIQGMTPEQIQQYLALPKVPTQIADVSVPSGTRMQVGTVAPQPAFGAPNVGGTQYQLLQQIPSSSFGVPKPLY